MAETLPRATRDRLTRALSTWASWDAGLDRQPEAERLLASHSNTNVLIRSGTERFVVRLNRDARHLGVDRDVERTVLEDIAGKPYAPTLVYLSDDFIVSRYIEGARIPEDPAAVADLLRAVHTTPTRIETILDPIDHARRYFFQLADPGPRTTRLVEAVFARPEPRAARTCLCHLDPSPPNLLQTPTGLTAIDWEYARRGAPAYDLATYIECAGLGAAGANTLVECYGEIDDTDVRHMRVWYRLIEGLWWQLESGDAEPSWHALEALLD
ncbi:MAG: phosphotransferase [Gammaproteobacteria bacterium]|nr:phosphotransferase [Gammaproteobacteria bacterium]